MLDALWEFVHTGPGGSGLVVVAVVVAAVFLGAFLWKILSSEEGFLFGYGNWIFGKWQERGASSTAAPQEQTQQATVTAQTVPRPSESGKGAEAKAPSADPQQKRELSAVKRELQVKSNVLTLSRLLDGDLAYLMMNDAGKWEEKIMQALQTAISGVTRVVRPAGRCRCGFFILDDEEQHLVLVVGEGYAGTRQPRLGLEQSCAGRAFLTGDDYYCKDINTDPVYWHSGRGNHDFRSIACVPVRSGRSVFGVICLDAEDPNAFSQEDFVHLEVFAAKLAVFCAFHALQVGVCSVRPEEG